MLIWGTTGLRDGHSSQVRLIRVLIWGFFILEVGKGALFLSQSCKDVRFELPRREVSSRE